MALTTFYSFKSKISPQNCETLNVLKKLGCNKDLIITKPDKGNGVVLLNKRDYVRKMEHLLQDFTSSIKLMKV